MLGVLNFSGAAAPSASWGPVFLARTVQRLTFQPLFVAAAVTMQNSGSGSVLTLRVSLVRSGLDRGGGTSFDFVAGDGSPGYDIIRTRSLGPNDGRSWIPMGASISVSDAPDRTIYLHANAFFATLAWDEAAETGLTPVNMESGQTHIFSCYSKTGGRNWYDGADGE